MSFIHRTRLAAAASAAGLALAAAAPAPAGGVLEVPGPLDLTIQEAIDIAESLGATQLNIAPGTYAESVVLPDNGYDLVLMGNPDDPGQVVIDPSLAGLDDSAVHILHGQSAATQLVGLTLTGGNADGVDDGDGAPWQDERGGGIYLNGSSVTVVDCVFQDNAATFGGAFYSNSSSSASFTRCHFAGNQAGVGGAAYVNHGTLSFTDCTFTGNSALSGNGGGLQIASATTTTIERCTFEGNTSAHDGGAIWSSSTLSALRSVFVANSAAAARFGGGLYLSGGTATIRDSILNGNTAGNTGSAVYAATGSTLTLVNATVVHNAGGNVIFGAGTKTIRGSIVWSNGGTIGGGANAASYSMIQGGFAGQGNISPPGGPGFVDAGGADATAGTLDDDLRLAPGSPGIDAGDATAVTGEYPLDLDGLPRGLDDPGTPDTGNALLGIAVDMGAYEFQPAGGSPTCPGDLDGDGSVGIADLLGLLGGWGACR